MSVWDERRAARLGYLVALGWDAGRIAADSVVAATPAEVHRQVSRLSLGFRQPVDGAPLNLPGPRMAYFQAAARRRRLPDEALLRKLLEAVADERLVDTLLGAEPASHDAAPPTAESAETKTTPKRRPRRIVLFQRRTQAVFA